MASICGCFNPDAACHCLRTKAFARVSSSPLEPVDPLMRAVRSAVRSGDPGPLRNLVHRAREGVEYMQSDLATVEFSAHPPLPVPGGLGERILGDKAVRALLGPE